MLFESKFPALAINVLVRTVSATGVIFFSWDPGKVESCVSVGTLSVCYRSHSLTKTLSYCSPAFDCKIRIYLLPNLSFAALFHVEYNSYDSLVWHTRVFYLVVLIEHIFDWNIQTRL